MTPLGDKSIPRYPYADHDKGIVLTQPRAGEFERAPMTAAQLAAREPALTIAKDIYRHANQAGVCYYDFWLIISEAIQKALDAVLPPIEPKAEQEPIAWRYRLKGTDMQWRMVNTADECNPSEAYEREPLYGYPWDYTAPSAIAAPSPLGFCIMADDGRMYWGEGCISNDKNDLSGDLQTLQEDEPEDGWKIVPFYAAAPFQPDWANYRQGRADGTADNREVTNEMVKRFLCWRLPEDFAPDCGISFDGRKPDQWNPSGKGWPVGTNLFTAVQALAMLEHVLAQPTERGPT